jgi:GNAT superfamily N-acetyltransferase
MSVNLSITRARARQSEELSRIAWESKSHWGYPQHWLESWLPDLTLTPDFIQENPVFIASQGGELAGLYALCLSGNTAELEHFWVVPKFIGSGVGRGLFEHALEQARQNGAERLLILSDPNAAGFYRRMGAETIGEGCYWLDGEVRILPRLCISLRSDTDKEAFRDQQ